MRRSTNGNNISVLLVLLKCNNGTCFSALSRELFCGLIL